MRVPSLRASAQLLEDLARSMERVAAIGNVHANALTGSLLLEGSRLSMAELDEIGRREGWFALALQSPVEMPDAAAQALRHVVPLAVLGLAAVQAARGHLLPSALSLLLRAIDLDSSGATRMPLLPRQR